MDHQTLVVTGGVDTHKATHVAAVVDPTGRLLATQSFPATPTGYTQMAAWMNSFGLVDRIGIEGTGSYGAGLARHFTNTGIRVVEVNRTNRQTRRAHGKNDTIDAVAAARAALSGQATTTPKTRDGIVESIRVIRIAFRSARDTRATIGIQIRDLIMCGPDELRVALEALTTSQQADKAARFRPGPITDPVEATRAALRSLARRSRSCSSQRETTRNDSPQTTRSRRCAVPHQSKRPPGTRPATGSTAAGTAKPTTPSGASRSSDSHTTPEPRPTPNDDEPKAKPKKKPCAASNDTSPERSTTSSPTPTPPPSPTPATYAPHENKPASPSPPQPKPSEHTPHASATSNAEPATTPHSNTTTEPGSPTKPPLDTT